MAKYEDYAKKYATKEPDKLDDQIDAAAAAKEERQDSTPDGENWQAKYEELNKAFSRQGNVVGEQKRLIDEYITSSTSQEPSVTETPPEPLTVDNLYDNPQEAIDAAIANHPAVKEAQEIKQSLAQRETEDALTEFRGKHPDYEDIYVTPEFQNWVMEAPMRQSLAVSADQMDFHSADALFTLYKADKAIASQESTAQNAAAIAAAELETPAGGEPPAPQQYSRSEMLQQKIRAKQGDLTADQYVKTHAAAYREALGNGNVRD